MLLIEVSNEISVHSAFIHIFIFLCTVQLQDEEGNTALHCCARNGHFTILNFLLQPQYRTNAHITNVYLDTPLHAYVCFFYVLQIIDQNCYWNILPCDLQTQSLFPAIHLIDLPFHLVFPANVIGYIHPSSAHIVNHLPRTFMLSSYISQQILG